MKNFFICTIIIIQIILLGGCAKPDDNISDDEIQMSDDEIQTLLEQQDIVFVYSEQNFSTFYTNLGYFIDNHGNKCYFDLSDEDKEYAGINPLYQYLCEHIDEYEEVPFLSEEQIKECYSYLLKIDENAEIIEESFAADGEYCIFYGIRVSAGQNPTCIRLRETGAFVAENTDPHVVDIMKIIGEDSWQKVRYE